MTFRKPPKGATWLLRHFGCNPDNDPILGDLSERYQTRENSLWYWRQVFIAIFESFIKETWGSKLHSALAIVIGWSTLASIWLVFESFSGQPVAWNRHVCTLMWFIAGLGSGWAVGLATTHRSRPMILLYTATVVIFLIGLHRPPASQVVVYWIDTFVLSTSILVSALTFRYPASHASSAAVENA